MLLPMRKPWIAIPLALLCAMRIAAQLEDTDQPTQAKCAEYLKTPLPAEGLAVPAPKTWPDCDSYKSYSGIDRKVNYAAARQCAWSERLAQQGSLEPRYSEESVFGGSAMLAVLYANGRGVPKNIPLAIRFACEAGGAPAEIESRTKHLESLDATASENSTKFSFCDDITSGFMQGFCAARASEIRDQTRAESLDAFVSHFTPSQRLAFDKLRKSEETYALAHATGEIDLSGTARAMFQIEAQDTLRDDFLAALQQYEKGTLPSQSTAQYSDADERLNSAYRKAFTDAEEHKNDYGGAVQPSGIRDAERAWLEYRDAWIAFAKLRYPSVPASAWLALLTNDRTGILDGSRCDTSPDVERQCAPNGDTRVGSPLP
jgi:uncharacterized protein YecT (DUF1311 family)